MSWSKAPIDSTAIGHRLVDQGKQVGLVFLEELACIDRMCRVEWSCILADGVEIGEESGSPIAGTVVNGGRALPFAAGQRLFVQRFQFFAKLRVQSLDAKFILLPDVAWAFFKIRI